MNFEQYQGRSAIPIPKMLMMAGACLNCPNRLDKIYQFDLSIECVDR